MTTGIHLHTDAGRPFLATRRSRGISALATALLASALLAGCGGPAAPGTPVTPGSNTGSGDERQTGGLTTGKTATWARVASGMLNPNPTYFVHSDTKAEFTFPNGSGDELSRRSWCAVLTGSADGVNEILITMDGTTQTCDEIFAN